jgi:hypothetical protein
MTEPNQQIPKPEACEPQPYTRSERLLFAIGGRVVLAFVLLLGAGSIVGMTWLIVWAVRYLWFSK